MRLRLTSRWLAALLSLLALAAPASAHFNLDANIRVVHVSHVAGGLEVRVRTPAPYLLAPRRSGEAPLYTRTLPGSGREVHYVDLGALRRDAGALRERVATGYDVTIDGDALTAEVVALRVFSVLEQPPFASAEEAGAAFEVPDLLATPSASPPFAGEAVIDAWLRFSTPRSTSTYAFSSTLRPAIEATDQTANVLLDHFPGGTQVFRTRGLLDDAVVVSRSALHAGTTFVAEGVRHILEGLDHVLFVLCLAIGAASLRALIWRVTGFTLGHTVTLIAGFLGIAPTGAWFVPAVETGIAVSIGWAALIAVNAGGTGNRRMDGGVGSAAGLGPKAAGEDGAGSDEWAVSVASTVREPALALVAVPALVGLLHGLGFAFVLGEILRIDAPNLWQSLLAFNVGVEVGQLAIVVPTFVLLVALAARSRRLAEVARWAVVVPCLALSALWATQRAADLLAVL